MLVVMKAQATPEQVQAVCDHIEQLGFRAHPMPGAQRTAIGITGNQGEIETGVFDEMEGVGEVIRVSKPYKLVSRDVKDENTVIRVADQGQGLSPEDLGRLFGRFQRLSAKPTAGESSTGLGLSIVKRIIDMHGGEVTARSDGPGLGSTFTILLPATE